MWEETRLCSRTGRPHRVLVWRNGTRDRITFDALTDSQVQHWHRELSRRCLFHESRLLRDECERRGLSARPEDLPGQLALPFPTS